MPDIDISMRLLPVVVDTNSLSSANFVGCVVNFLNVCKIRLLAASLSFESEMVLFSFYKEIGGFVNLFRKEFLNLLDINLLLFQMLLVLWVYSSLRVCL
jgi:hypothetical protein